MNYWFTSDWHIGHHNILKYDERPYATVEEMNKSILENFNDCVQDGDEVYFLGDLAFNVGQGIEILAAAKGHWNFILGNHDKNLEKIVLGANKEARFHRMLEKEIDGQLIVMNHYPMISWNKSHWGSWHLFGHNHKMKYEELKGKRMNVCINLTNYQPVSFGNLKIYMDQREIDLGRPE